MDEQVGWLTANDGTLYKTESSGDDWVTQHIPTAKNLVNIHFINHQEGFVIDNEGILFFTANGGSDWINVDIGDYIWLDVYFINETTGWLSGNQVLYKTTDGGTSWNVVYTATTDEYPAKIHFFNELEGVTGGSNGYFATTVDGGDTWQEQQDSIFLNVFGYSVLHSGQGLIVGGVGHIFKTEDGGSSWDILSSNINRNLEDVTMVDPFTGWIVGGDGLILKTEDAGLSWFEQDSGTDLDLYAVHFLDQQTGWATGHQGIILKTTNGGENWEIAAQHSWLRLYDIFFINESMGWAFGSGGRILKTIDGGETWQQTTLPIGSGNFYSIHFFNELTGIVAGVLNTIYKTYDGGETWELKYYMNTMYDSIQSLAFADDLHGWAAGTLTQMRTTDGGETWSVMQELNVDEFTDVHFVDEFYGIMVGYAGRFFQTQDGGDTWESVIVRNRFGFSGISVSGSTGILIGFYGSIMRTDQFFVNLDRDNVDVHTFQLNQNYPNPFNPSTTIPFELFEASNVRMEVYDMLGRRVALLVNETLQAGRHTAVFDAGSLPSGVYIARLQAGGVVFSRKMLLVK